MAAEQQRFLTAYKTLGRFRAEVFKVVYLGSEDVTPDKQLGSIKGSKRIDWAPYPGTNECVFLEKRFKSKDGRAEIIIFLGMFYYATEAFIDLSLFTMDTSAVSVGGVVTVRPCNSTKPEFSSSLFMENTGRAIKVQSGERIPLSRSIVVLPLKCKLFLDINLSCDDEIIASTLEFDASLKGTVHKILLGTKCEIKAKVIWNVKHESLGALNDKIVYSEEEMGDEDWLTDDDEDWPGETLNTSE
ncbi:hypothetical protein AgCh_001340 [Apium graveolens]